MVVDSVAAGVRISTYIAGAADETMDSSFGTSAIRAGKRRAGIGRFSSVPLLILVGVPRVPGCSRSTTDLDGI